MHLGSPLDPSQTTAEQGIAKLGILDFKTTWSEFQKLIRLLLSEAKPSYVYSILKLHGQSSKRQVQLLLSEVKPSCIYLILKPHGKSFRRPVRPLLSEAKPSYIYSILKPPGQSSRSQSDCC